MTLTPELARVLGFEDPGDWSNVNSTSPIHSEGQVSASVPITGWTELRSPALGPLGSVGEVASLDVQLPAAVSWGEVRLIVQVPSEAVYWQEVGSVGLSGRSPGQFHTLEFSLPQGLRTQMEDAPDTTFIVALNAPAGTYLVDRLTLEDAGGSDPGSGSEGELRIELTAGLDLVDVVFGASQEIRLADRGQLLGEDGFAAMSNTGTAQVHIGVDAKTGNISSRGPLFLSESARVEGPHGGNHHQAERCGRDRRGAGGRQS